MEFNQKRLLDIFYALVKISAISKEEKPVSDFISNFISELGYTYVTDDAGEKCQGNTGNLIVSISPEHHTSQLVFLAHMDTIKPTAGVLPQILDGKIKSDGTTILGADNRAGIAILLYTIEQLKNKNVTHIPFEIIFTIGEETGFYGSSHLDLTKVTARNAYVLDASADPGNYIYSAPGARGFEATFTGRASHAAVNPAAGINALKMASAFVENTPLGQVDDQTTINIGKLVSGEANNVVPPVAHLSGEIRSFSAERITQYYKEIVDRMCHIARDSGGQSSIEIGNEFPGFCIDPESPVIRNLEKHMHKSGLVPNALRYHGGSDANILNNRGFTAINLGIGAKNPHANDEYIELASLEKISNLVFHLISVYDNP